MARGDQYDPPINEVGTDLRNVTPVPGETQHAYYLRCLLQNSLLGHLRAEAQVKTHYRELAGDPPDERRNQTSADMKIQAENDPRVSLPAKISEFHRDEVQTYALAWMVEIQANGGKRLWPWQTPPVPTTPTEGT